MGGSVKSNDGGGFTIVGGTGINVTGGGGIANIVATGETSGLEVTDGTTTVNPVSEINFTAGATVTDSGSGVASVAITGGGGGGSVPGSATATDLSVGESVPTASDLQNTFIGGSIALSLDGATNNTGVGYQALNSLTTGVGNVALGVQAGSNITVGQYNIELGSVAATTGNNNISIGVTATLPDPTANSQLNINNLVTATANNVSIGPGSAPINGSNLYSTYVGYNAGNVGAADSNTGIGAGALQNSTEFGNTGVGNFAGQQITTGTLNTAIGYGALDHVTTGGANIALGAYAGNQITSGIGNICIGESVQVNDPTANNQLNIGNVINSDGADIFLFSPGTGTSLSVGDPHKLGALFVIGPIVTGTPLAVMMSTG